MTWARGVPVRGGGAIGSVGVVLILSVAIGCAGAARDVPVAPRDVPAAAAAPLPPLRKVTEISARIPVGGEVPELVGTLQRHRVAENETLLDIGRAAGVGFRALRAANPFLRQYVPRPGTEVVVPTRFVLPRSSYRGLVVNVAEMRLYRFPADARPGERVLVQTWPVGIGAEVAESPMGGFRITTKDEHPTWVVPDSIYDEMDEPRRRVVPPGPDNPLGDYRIRTSISLVAFHGTNDPWTVGRPTTHGCIRLYPEDIARLYDEVRAGEPGEFVYEPVKIGRSAGRVWLEVHADVYGRFPDLERHALDELGRAGLLGQVDRARVRAAIAGLRGVPEDVTT